MGALSQSSSSVGEARELIMKLADEDLSAEEGADTYYRLRELAGTIPWAGFEDDVYNRRFEKLKTYF